MRSRRGAAAITYALLVALVAGAVLLAIALTGDNVARLLGLAGDVIRGDTAPAAPVDGGIGDGTAGLHAEPPALSGLDVAFAGQPSYSAPATVALHNDTGSPVAGLSFALSPGFEIVSNDCPPALAAHAACQVTLRAVATLNGPLAGALSVLTADGAAGSFTVALSGNATGFAGNIAMSEDRLPLAPRLLSSGQPAPCTALPVGNAGSATLLGLTLALSGGDAARFESCTPAQTPCAGSLAVGATCNFGLRPAGTEVGVFESFAIVQTSDGSARQRPIIGSVNDSDSSLWIGRDLFLVAPVEAVAEGACTDLRVINVSTGYGLSNVQLAGFTGPQAGSFTACTPSAQPCGAALLGPYGTCNLGIRLTGIAANGTLDATVYVSSDDETPVTRAVESVANGFNPAIGLDLGVLAVTADEGTAAGPCQALRVTNTGIAPGLADVAIAGFISPAAQHFTACTPDAGGCGAVLAPGQSCLLGVALTALDSNASFDGSVQVVASDAADAVRPLRGTVTGFGTVLSLGTGTFALAASDAQIDGPCTDLAVTNAGSGRGLANLRIAGFGGSDAAHFAGCAPSSAACSGAALGAGESCNLGIRLSGLGSDALYRGTVSVIGGGSAAVSRDIAGEATGFAPVLELAPEVQGTVPVAGVDGAAQGACTAIAVRHNGNGPAVSGIAIAQIAGAAAANFRACDPGAGSCAGATLQAGERCNVGLQVTGAGVDGTLEASLTVRAPRAAAVTRAVAAPASGFVALISLGSGTLVLGSADNSLSGPCTDLPVTNSGTGRGVAGATVFAIDGSDGSHFQGCRPSAAECGSRALEAGETCNLGVRLVGADANRAYEADLSVRSSDIVAPVSRRIRAEAVNLQPVLSLGSGILAIAPVQSVATGACTDVRVTNAGTLPGLANIAVEGFSGGDSGNFDRCTPSGEECGGGTLAVGAGCNIGVRAIAASANRTYSATLAAIAAGGARATRAVSFAASGFTPTLEIGSGTLYVAASQGSETGPCTAFTVRNLANSGSASGIGIVGIAGDNAPNFEACSPGADSCEGRSLAPLESCTLGVRLRALRRDGTYSASMTVGATGASAASRAVQGSASGFNSVYECSGNYPADGACYCRPDRVTPGGAGWGGCPFFTNDSNPCRGALMLGKLTAEGGWIYVKNYPGLSGYCASSGNGVTTSGWGSWGGSFTVSADIDAGAGCPAGYTRSAGTGQCLPSACPAGQLQGYDIAALAHGAAATVGKIVAIEGGSNTMSATASCSLGTVTLAGEAVTATACAAGYTASGTSCLRNSCAAGSAQGYSYPLLADGVGQQVTRSEAVEHGSRSFEATASCGGGTVTIAGERETALTCDSGYGEQDGACTPAAVLPAQCSTARMDSDISRLTTYNPGAWGACESDLGWVRFTQGTGRLNAQPLGANRCNASASGWYDGAYPAATGETVSGTAWFDFSYGGNDYSHYASRSIQITNCGAYMVYNLPGVGCSYRYCVAAASSEIVCPAGYTGASGSCQPMGCSAGESGGYSYGSLASGASQPVSRTASLSHGSVGYTATAACSGGIVNISGEAAGTPSCDSGYTASGSDCVAASAGRWERQSSDTVISCTTPEDESACNMLVDCSYDYETAACSPLGDTCYAWAANRKLLLQYTCRAQ